MDAKDNITKKKNSVLFGQWLVVNGFMTQSDLESALAEQRKTGGRLGEVLRNLELLDNKNITDALAQYLDIGRVHLDDLSIIDTDISRTVPENIAKRFGLVAIGRFDDNIVVAMSDPLNVIAIDTLTVKLKSQIEVVISSISEIQHAIEVVYHGADIEEQQLRDLVEIDRKQEQDNTVEDMLAATDLISEDAANKAPVIRFVDLMLSQAIKNRTSDIHIEPQENSMIIRMRVDGILNHMVPPPRKMQLSIIARIKILSDMDIAERRLPQDGRFEIKTPDRKIDVRVSTIPTIYGEKIVMRILDKKAVNHDLAQLGLEPNLLATFKAILSQPHGIIIVTGPTGSGKSTTLYSALDYLRDPHKNITTVEDPVEYRLDGINQIQIKSEIDLDFASCLRAILRQDPDIILIGEIRDRETAEIAIKASLTGHLVLSTFHTNDAPSALSRLIYMGVESYLLASTLNLVVAQRLIRRICRHCKEPVQLSEKVLTRLGITTEQAENETFYHGKGCDACGGTGYMGRAPIFEFLLIDQEVREKMVSGASEVQIREMARTRGYGGLLEDGACKLRQGITTAEEILSATFTEDLSYVATG